MNLFTNEHFKLQPWETEDILVLVFSLIFFIILQPVTRFLLSTIVPQFNSFDELRKRDWISRWISTLHAIIFVCLSAYVLFISGQIYDDIYTGEITTSCPVTYPTLLFSCGYFIVDSYYAFRYFFDLGTIAHHLGATFICTMMVSYRIAGFYMIIYGLTEASTPFVNFRVFLVDLKLKDSILYVLNGISMWLGFLIFRIPLIFYIPYYMIKYSANFFLNKAVFAHWFTAVGGYTLISILNIYWFYLITKGLVKAFSNTSSKPMKKDLNAQKQSKSKTKKED